MTLLQQKINLIQTRATVTETETSLIITSPLMTNDANTVMKVSVI